MDEAVLIWETTTKDEDGYPVTVEHRAPIFAMEKSVTRTEHYQARDAGVRVKTILEVRIEDYEQSAHMEEGYKTLARKIEFDGSTYTIERAYKKDKATIELSCI